MQKLFLITLILTVSSFTFGQTKLTENTIRIDKETKGAEATVSDMEWMAGSWAGQAFGGDVRETWTKTDGGLMMGMYVLEKENQAVFYEFLIFQVVDGELFLRLKHFNPDMTGWEEKEKTVDFRFVKKEGNRYYFRGLTFENAGENSLNIYLALRQKDKTYKEEVFKMKRVD
ncbi:MAG: DUF6265 family protein [Acidobacteriota bacterium]|nr:DUF6265 family protein [Acidobacteriota bacterium]MDH3529381.1 DUF6265 family protein [Acidobacteriota bacterium]